MTATTNLLDKYREACSLTSDNQLAVALGVTRQSAHAWRKGSAWPSEDHIYKMATAIKEEPTKWLVGIHAERSSGPVKKEWVQLAKTLGFAPAAIAIALGLAVYTPKSDATAASAGNFTITAPAIHYAYCSQVVHPSPAQGRPTNLVTDRGLRLLRIDWVGCGQQS